VREGGKREGKGKGKDREQEGRGGEESGELPSPQLGSLDPRLGGVVVGASDL